MNTEFDMNNPPDHHPVLIHQNAIISAPGQWVFDRLTPEELNEVHNYHYPTFEFSNEDDEFQYISHHVVSDVENTLLSYINGHITELPMQLYSELFERKRIIYRSYEKAIDNLKNDYCMNDKYNNAVDRLIIVAYISNCNHSLEDVFKDLARFDYFDVIYFIIFFHPHLIENNISHVLIHVMRVSDKSALKMINMNTELFRNCMNDAICHCHEMYTLLYKSCIYLTKDNHDAVLQAMHSNIDLVQQIIVTERQTQFVSCDILHELYDNYHYDLLRDVIDVLLQEGKSVRDMIKSHEDTDSVFTDYVYNLYDV